LTYGGFQAKEALVLSNQERLKLEIDKLRAEIEAVSKSNPKIIPVIKEIIDTVGNIASIASLIIK